MSFSGCSDKIQSHQRLKLFRLTLRFSTVVSITIGTFPSVITHPRRTPRYVLTIVSVNPSTLTPPLA